MSYWIIVTNASKDEPSLGARDVLKRRLGDGFYGVPTSARYQRELFPGDKVIFYLAGGKEKVFVADGVLKSGVEPLSSEERNRLYHSPAFSATQGFYIEESHWWDREFPLALVRERVPKFKEYGKNPGAFMQGSIVPISREDYEAFMNL